MMALVPRDIFLATPGCRESTRWVSGQVPPCGLVPDDVYWVLSDCGVVGELVDEAPADYPYFGRVRYLGAVCDDRDEVQNIRRFALTRPPTVSRNPPIYLVLGTSGDAGKTTAVLAVLRTLRLRDHSMPVALKATGTPDVRELATYRDYGAADAFDCVDFGVPTTYPTGRPDIGKIFDTALDYCLSLPADALIVECGGDLFGANVPEFLSCLKRRCLRPKVILAAADTLGAIGAKQVLTGIGLQIDLITGPCTDTPAMRERTQALCGVPAINLLRGDDGGLQSAASDIAASA